MNFISFSRPAFPSGRLRKRQIECHGANADNLSEKLPIFAAVMNGNEEKYMRQALVQAMQAYEADEVPVGAVIVHDGRIIARAYNMTEHLNDPTAHAEMQAITMATEYIGGKYLCDCEIYVTVEPCPMCAAALSWAQISRVVYGAPDPKRGYSLFSPSLLHPRTEVVPGVLEEECRQVITDFFKGKR